MSKTIEISRELLEASVSIPKNNAESQAQVFVVEQIRALLAAPTVERQSIELEGDGFYFATASECTSCDGSGEYIDAIGDWRGYCSCPAGTVLIFKDAPEPVSAPPSTWTTTDIATADADGFRNGRASVLIPERKAGDYLYSHAWNACLDKFAELNK